MAWTSRAHSDAGRRPYNEDSWLQASDLGLFAVADGMGGHADGDLASRTAVATLERAARHGAALGEALAAASAAVFQAARERGSNMGTTLLALQLAEDGRLAWLGDSRAYCFRDGQLQQLSRDHSRVQELLEAGLISPAQARHHPQRPVLTAAAGLEPDSDPEQRPVNPDSEDIFLLCSDGLSDTLDEEEMAAVMEKTAPDDMPRALVDAALAKRLPHQDNTTAVVVWRQPHAEKGKT
jgi:serine/threonine protein phosphatase PrpC